MFISASQMAAFEASALRAFEDRTYRHLQQYFPRHCVLLGEPQMKCVIQHGWARARSHQFTAESCVRSYVEFMCLLGSGFDVDPLLPWAARILADHSAPNEIARADRLHDAVWEYINHVVPDFVDSSGKPITARFVADLRRLRAMPDEPLTRDAFPAFARDACEWIYALFPAKARHVGEPAVNRVVVEGAEAARGYSLGGRQGSTLFILLRFLLGVRFDQDPLLPWVCAALNDHALAPQGKLLDKLYIDGAAFLRRWWDLAPAQPR